MTDRETIRTTLLQFLREDTALDVESLPDARTAELLPGLNAPAEEEAVEDKREDKREDKPKDERDA